ncbi:hypothetical protein PQR34_43050, partial [Paraburkholderia sediminicola]|uniref:hypothetical protein n=1 Tax=Paraburkholderia sediminicola TaxID=458836 RepID=UPI0038B931D0
FEAGERWYRTAANEYVSMRVGGPEFAALALAHMALEATRTGAPNSAALVTEAEAHHKKHPHGDARLVLDSIKRAQPASTQESSLPKTPLVLNARTWRHDAANNVLIVENLKPFKE